MSLVSAKLRHTVLTAGAVVTIGTAMAATPASAQFFGGLFGGPAPGYEDAIIPPVTVARILRGEGYRMIDMPVRRGMRIIAMGEDGRGQMMRFIIDGRDGQVIRTALIGAPRPPGYIGGDHMAYGQPDRYEPAPQLAPDQLGLPPAAKPKPKPHVKTAARPPLALPKAAPASPTPPPSQAVKPPEPVTPAIQPAETTPASPTPPVAVTTPAAAPETRPAPDAQPADIGPKAVPVAPAQARAPEVAPPVSAEPQVPIAAPAPPAPPEAAAPDAKPAAP